MLCNINNPSTHLQQPNSLMALILESRGMASESLKIYNNVFEVVNKSERSRPYMIQLQEIVGLVF
jgi:hypothetical protein